MVIIGNRNYLSAQHFYGARSSGPHGFKPIKPQINWNTNNIVAQLKKSDSLKDKVRILVDYSAALFSQTRNDGRRIKFVAKMAFGLFDQPDEQGKILAGCSRILKPDFLTLTNIIYTRLWDICTYEKLAKQKKVYQQDEYKSMASLLVEASKYFGEESFQLAFIYRVIYTFGEGNNTPTHITAGILGEAAKKLYPEDTSRQMDFIAGKNANDNWICSGLFRFITYKRGLAVLGESLAVKLARKVVLGMVENWGRSGELNAVNEESEEEHAVTGKCVQRILEEKIAEANIVKKKCALKTKTALLKARLSGGDLKQQVQAIEVVFKEFGISIKDCELVGQVIYNSMANRKKGEMVSLAVAAAIEFYDESLAGRGCRDQFMGAIVRQIENMEAKIEFLRQVAVQMGIESESLLVLLLFE